LEIGQQLEKLPHRATINTAIDEKGAPMFIRSTLLIAAFAFSALGADHVAGTWKLNTAKSKYVGIPTPKDLTVTYTPAGQGWKYDGKGTTGDGQPVNMTFTYSKDGEDMPMTGYPYADTLSLRGGNTDSSTATFKRGGKVVGTAKRTISKDGKTMTVSANLTLPDGKKGSYTSVYDKQ
jgi:hypothetical protein